MKFNRLVLFKNKKAKINSVSNILLMLALSSCAQLGLLDKKETIKDHVTIENSSAKGSFDKKTDELKVLKTEDRGEYIVGSADIDESSDHHSRAYFLYGAEHLGLDNYYFDIPVVYNKAVKKWIKYFLNRGRGFFERYSARAGRYAPVLGDILEKQGLPRDLIFLAMAESGFQNNAKSWAKAVGPWQFMPYTGKRFGLKIDWYVDERRDPIKATYAAARYLKKLYSDFGAWELAAAAYNAGEGKMGRAIKRYRTESFWKLRKGRYLKAETKNYVPKIMALAIIGKNLKSFGFEDIDFHDRLKFDEIEVGPMTDLVLLSESLDMDYSTMSKYNPEVLRWFTPPGKKHILRLPTGYIEKWKTIDNKEVLVATKFKKYKIKSRRASLTDVARKFKIKKSYVLQKLNGISSKRQLKKGSYVKLPFRTNQNIKDKMYADLYEVPRKSVRRRRAYRKRILLAKRRGRRISSPKAYYTVQKGDSLWTVSRKTGVSLDTIIVSNLKIIKSRMIRAGDKLVIR